MCNFYNLIIHFMDNHWMFTLCGGLSISASQGNHTLVHFDANYHAPLLKVLGEKFPTICLLVEGLMEEDDATDAGLDAVVGGEQQLAVQSPVLFRVLSIDALEPLGHTTCTGSTTQDSYKTSN